MTRESSLRCLASDGPAPGSDPRILGAGLRATLLSAFADRLVARGMLAPGSKYALARGGHAQSLAGRVQILQQFERGPRRRFGMGAIHTFCGNRQLAVFERSYPAFFFHIPEMKLQMLTRTA
jgi:hypothetical protein